MLLKLPTRHFLLMVFYVSNALVSVDNIADKCRQFVQVKFASHKPGS